MNHILKLQEGIKERGQRLAVVQRECNEFLTFLHSDKFKGFSSDGSRKDWISVNDVIDWIITLRSETRGIE